MLGFKELTVQFIYAFIAVYSFAVFFNSPRKLNLYSALSGASAWVFYKILASFGGSIIVPYFAASFMLAMFSEFYARSLKHPSIVFTIPALIPFVPGYGIYYMMKELLNSDYQEAIKIGAESVFIAIAIASGVIVATSISRIIFNKKRFSTVMRNINNK